MLEEQPASKPGRPSGNPHVAAEVGKLNPERVRERFFNDSVTDAAEYYGWRTFHLRDKDSIHIVRGRGFPDLVMFRKNPDDDGIDLLAAELKRDYDSVTTDRQDEWLEALGHHIPVYTWRPGNWDEIEQVLSLGTTVKPGNWLPTPEPSNSPVPSNFGDRVTNIIEDIEASEMPTGDKASLRRMDPAHPNSAIFWKLIAQRDMPPNLSIERWGLITHGIAVMSHGAGLAHNPRRSVGQTLYNGSGDNPERGWYSEHRLSTLLAASGPTLHQLLGRLFRMLASERCAFNWCEMAWFIVNEGHDRVRAEEARIRIARDYYQAQRRNSQQSATQGD